MFYLTQTRKEKSERFLTEWIRISEQLEEVTKTCEDLKRQNERYRKQHTEVESEFRTLRVRWRILRKSGPIEFTPKLESNGGT